MFLLSIINFKYETVTVIMLHDIFTIMDKYYHYYLYKEMQSIFIIDGDFQVSLFRPCFIYISINRYKIYTMLFVFSSDIETVLNVKILGEKMTII